MQLFNHPPSVLGIKDSLQGMNKTCFLLNRRSLGWGDHGNERLWKSGFRSIWRCISCSSILVNCANKTAGRRYGFYVLRDRYSFLFYNMSFMKMQISLCRLTKYLGELEFLEYLQRLRTYFGWQLEDAVIPGCFYWGRVVEMKFLYGNDATANYAW